MEENKRLTNTFRDGIQATEASEDELMLRDMIIMARAMEANHALTYIRQRMLQSTLTEVVTLQNFMLDQPMSPGLPELTEAANLQVEATQKALEDADVSRADAVQLAALQAAITLGKTGTSVSILPCPGQTGMPTHPIPYGFDVESEDIKAPIEDDGLPKEGEDDDSSDEREEEIEMVDPNEVPVKLEAK